MGKPQFGAVPNRAFWDRRLTDRDVRNLGVVAAHDRLSSVTGKGQGAWASHARFAALAGTEYSRFSVSINKLLKLGYLDRQPLATDRRKFTYRVLYNNADSLPSSKEPLPEIVCSEANDEGEMVCSDSQLSGCNLDESAAQYISQSEELDSAKAGKIDSENQRVLANAPARQWEDDLPAGAQLAIIERTLTEPGAKLDCLTLYDRVGALFDCAEDNATRGWAMRLAGQLVEAMNEDEYRTWGTDHGWVDDDGKWHAPHPRQNECAIGTGGRT